jgi:heme exporter protein A
MTAAAAPFAAHFFEIQNVAAEMGGKLLFQHINARLEAGQLLRIQGANGSGKTTLLRIISGLSEAESGKVLWNRQSIQDGEAYFRQISFIGHKDGLKDDRTALENLQFYQHLYQVENSDNERLLLRLNLLHHADTLTRYLSFGQRRRLALLRLLLSGRPLWLLDEPFTGIDAEGRALISEMFCSHLSRGGMIIMTHHGDLEHKALHRLERQIVL